MADTDNTQLLARHIDQVKKLAPNVTLQNYYQEIKPFLFGSEDTTLTNLSAVSQGIYSIAKSGIMSPSDSQVIIQILGKPASKFWIANVRNPAFIKDVQEKRKPASQFLFPSDLVRILTGLARIFREGDVNNKYNHDGLSAYTGSSTDLRLVKKWGEVDVEPALINIGPGLFYEAKFETKFSGEVAKLLQQVALAAIEYEKLRQPLNTTNFEPKSEIDKKIIVDLGPKILENFGEYKEKVKPEVEKEEKFRDASEKIIKKITELLNESTTDTTSPLFSRENNLQFAKNKIYSSERNFYLWETKSDGTIGLKETEEYKKFVTNAIKTFLEKYEDFLKREYIDPLFKTGVTAGAAEGDEDAEQSGQDKQEDKEEKIELEDPISLEDFTKKLKEDLVPKIYEEFVKSFIFANTSRKELFEPKRDKFEEKHIDPISDNISQITEQRIVNNFKVLDEEVSVLKKQKLFNENQFSRKVFESSWYDELLNESIQYISKLPSPESGSYSYFEFLYVKFVVPALDLLYEENQKDINEEEKVAAEDKKTDLSSATVPTSIQQKADGSPSQASSGDISRLSPEEVRSLQYESAWIYNRAVYELFTAHGLSESDIDPAFLDEMRSGVFNYVAGMDETARNLMFGSASHRQKALFEFYQKYNYRRLPGLSQKFTIDEYVSNLKKSPAWSNLSQTQRESLEKAKNRVINTDISNIKKEDFYTEEELLMESLKSSFDADNPVLTKNIQNTIDTLIIQYGIQQTFYAYNPETEEIVSYLAGSDKDVIWLINGMSDSQLALIFNLPPDSKFSNPEILNLLKQTLVKYAQYRASDLALHIKSTSLAKGLVPIGAEPQLSDSMRASIKIHGGKTVVGALDEKNESLDEDGKTIREGSNRKEIIKRQFASFIPLWAYLSPEEQRFVYLETLGYYPKDNPEYDSTGYPFIPEFLFFDLSKLKSVKKISKDNNLSENDKEHLLEIIALNEQLAQEEAFAKYLKESYAFNSDETELVEIGQELGIDSEESLERNTSYREQFAADQNIQGNYEWDDSYETNESRNGLIPKFLNSKNGKKLKDRFGKGVKKKLSPSKKATKGFKNAANDLITKAAVAGSNLVVPGLGAALMAIPNKKIRDAIAKLIVGGLTFVISSTIYALGSIGGLIGGVIGGILGGILSGGTMIIPGVIAGAHIGNFIMPQRWTGNVFGSGSSAATAAQTAETIATQKAIEASNLATTAAAVLTTTTTVALPVFITLYVLMVIQGAFLIPVPNERIGVAINPIGAIGMEGCDDSSPLSSKLTKNDSFPLAARAFDIVSNLRPGFWCYWNWNTEYDGLNESFSANDSSERPDLFDEVEFYQYPNHCVYRDNFPEGCGGDWKNADGDVLYWCTWLVNHTYEQNYSLVARAMAEQFRTLSGHIFMPVETVTYADIQPGDTIFTTTAGRNGNIGHVAIVHDVGPDFIRSIDSNSSSRFNEYTVGDDGKVIVDSIPYLGVVGFGRRL